MRLALTVVFPVLLCLSAVAFWLLDLHKRPHNEQVLGAVTIGLGAGLFIGRFGTAMVAGLMAATVWAWLVRRRRATAAGGVS